MQWEWRWPKNSFLAASKRVCIDLCEQVLEVEGLRRDRGKTFLRGRLRTREGFMRVLGLSGPSAEECDRPVSWLARFRSTGEGRRRRGSAASDAAKEGPPPFVWREFPDRAALDRWLERAHPEDLEIMAWMGNGQFVFEEDRSAAAPVPAPIDGDWLRPGCWDRGLGEPG